MKAQNNKYKTLALLSLTLSFAACQEEQFFQKDMSQLSGPIVDISKTPGDIGSGGSGVIVDGGDTDSGNNGQTEQPTTPEVVTVKKVVKYKKEASIDFSGSIIKSKIRTPEVFYVFRRKRTHGGELNILPMNFNYHLAETRSITQAQLKK